MCSPASGLVPNFNAWLETAWGSGAEFWSSGSTGLFGSVPSLGHGQNPPYYLDDFLAFHPKFFGLPTALMGASVTSGSNLVTVISAVGVLIGQLVQSADFPPGTVVTAVTSTTITLNNNALTTNINSTLYIYEAPPIPVAVIQLYLNLAYSSLVKCGPVGWEEQWTVAMGWFIAHYCTLYARSDATEVLTISQSTVHGETPSGSQPGTVFTLSAVPTNGVLQGLYKNGVFQTPGIDYTLSGNIIVTTAMVVGTDVLYAQWPINTTTTTGVALTTAQIAAQGIANGIEVSKSVGDVSASYSVLESLKDFGQWNLTVYGQQLTTMARVVGAGPMLIW